MKEVTRFTPEAVIVGNGDFPSHPIPLKIMDNAPLVVCCDGGANQYIATGRTPHVIVGDGDSLSEENKLRFQSMIHYCPDQETNDQTKAMIYLRNEGKKHVAIVAATGKREDHTLGNISLLIDYMNMGMEVMMLTDYGSFVPAKGIQTFDSAPGQQISIFSFGTNSMQGKGLRYPLRDFTSWWQGTLNEAVSDSFSISCTGNYLVYRAYLNQR